MAVERPPVRAKGPARSPRRTSNQPDFLPVRADTGRPSEGRFIMPATQTSGAAVARRLPPKPSLEHLKNEAKQRLDQLRARAPTAKLAEAQHQLAREYGF